MIDITEHPDARIDDVSRRHGLALLAGGGLFISGLAFGQIQPVDTVLPTELKLSTELGTVQSPSITRPPEVALSNNVDGRLQRLADNHLKPSMALSLEPSPPPTARTLSTLTLPNLARWRASANEDDDDDGPLPGPGDNTGGMIPPGSRRPESNLTRESLETSSTITLPDLSGEEIGMAPIRYSGSMTNSFTRTKDSSGGKSMSMQRNYQLNGDSYVYQPWIAQVSGNFGFDTSRSRSYAGETTDDGNSKGEGRNFGGVLSLLPMTNTPFTANYQHTKGTNWMNDDGSVKNSQGRFNATQAWRPEGEGNESVMLTLDNALARGENNVKAYQTTINGTYTNKIEDIHTINGTAILSRNAVKPGNLKSKSLGMMGSHGWNYSDEMQMANNLFYSHSKNYLDNGDADASVLQASNNFSFQFYDEEDDPIPLTLSTANNLMHIVNDDDGVFSRTAVFSNQTSASYRFSDQLTGSQSTSLSRMIPSDGGRYITNTSSMSMLNYAGTPISIDDYQYAWGTNGGVFLTKTTDNKISKSHNASFFQSIARTFPLPDGSGLSLSVSESLNFMNTNMDGTVKMASHNIGGSWSKQFSPALSSTLNGSFSDNRSFGLTDDRINSLNFSGGAQAVLSSTSSLSIAANLNRNWSEQETRIVRLDDLEFDVTPKPWVGTLSIGYMKSGLFNIPRLNYNANINFGVYQNSRQILSGSTPDGYKPWLRNKVFTQQLNYGLGRIQFQALNMISQNESGAKSVILFGQVVRNLGGIF